MKELLLLTVSSGRSAIDLHIWDTRPSTISYLLNSSYAGQPKGRKQKGVNN